MAGQSRDLTMFDICHLTTTPVTKSSFSLCIFTLLSVLHISGILTVFFLFFLFLLKLVEVLLEQTFMVAIKNTTSLLCQNNLRGANRALSLFLCNSSLTATHKSQDLKTNCTFPFLYRKYSAESFFKTQMTYCHLST